MTSWTTQYAGALKARDHKEQICKEAYDSYTVLADRTTSWRGAGLHDVSRDDIPGPLPTKQHLQNNIREDLRHAQRGRNELQLHLKSVLTELDEVRHQFVTESNHRKELSTANALLVRRLKDQGEELQGKSKLLEEVHDEMVSLTLQLNMAEEHNMQLRKDNEELIDRWLQKVGEEAAALNKASQFS